MRSSQHEEDSGGRDPMWRAARPLGLGAYEDGAALQPVILPALKARTRLLELPLGSQPNDHGRLANELARQAEAAKGLRPTLDALLGRVQVLLDEEAPRRPRARRDRAGAWQKEASDGSRAGAWAGA